MTTTFRPTKCSAMTEFGLKNARRGDPIAWKPLAKSGTNAIIVPDTPAYRAAIASVTKKPTPKPARSRRKAKP